MIRKQLVLCFGALLLLAGFTACSNSKESKAESVANQKADAAKIVDVGAKKMESILSYKQTMALRNMLGGARAIFIAPYIHGEAALLGMQNGTGYLLCRHGQDWSDPAFFNISEFSIGEQAGAKEEHMIILFMTDKALNDFVKGKMDISGSGGFAIGTLGAGASGAGSINGGLELIIVSTNEGAFLGGGLGSMTPSPVPSINNDLYGPDTDPATILAAPGGKYAPADAVRKQLSEWVAKAWGS